MRLPRWSLVSLLLLLAAAAARADEPADPRAEARDCLQQLAAPDSDVRKKAADRIVELGAAAVEEVARGGAGLDTVAWEAFAGACERRTIRRNAGILVAAAHSARDMHRTRLLELARRLHPDAGKERTPAEVEAKVREIVGRPIRGCVVDFDEELVLLGHDAVAPILALLSESEHGGMRHDVACAALSALVEEEDVPALRGALLGGETEVSAALVRLRLRGVDPAEDPIYEAVAAGRLTRAVCDALSRLPDRARSAKAVLAWVEDQGISRPTDGQRSDVARLLEKLDAREAVPVLEDWVASTKSPSAFSALGSALTRLGSAKGIEVLVHIVGERRLRFPCRPSTPEEVAAETAPGRMCGEGFHSYERSKAAQLLSEIAGPGAFPTPTRKRDGQPSWDAADDETLDRAARAFREWWETSKDRLRFDPKLRAWTVGE